MEITLNQIGIVLVYDQPIYKMCSREFNLASFYTRLFIEFWQHAPTAKFLKRYWLMFCGKKSEKKRRNQRGIKNTFKLQHEKNHGSASNSFHFQYLIQIEFIIRITTCYTIGLRTHIALFPHENFCCFQHFWFWVKKLSSILYGFIWSSPMFHFTWNSVLGSLRSSVFRCYFWLFCILHSYEACLVKCSNNIQ